MDILLHMIGLAFIPLMMMAFYSGCRDIFDTLVEFHGPKYHTASYETKAQEKITFPPNIIRV